MHLSDSISLEPDLGLNHIILICIYVCVFTPCVYVYIDIYIYRG